MTLKCSTLLRSCANTMKTNSTRKVAVGTSEVDRDYPLEVVIEECSPPLRRRLASFWHQPRHCSFRNVNTQLQQFTMDSGCAPRHIGFSHLSYQSTDLGIHPRSPRTLALRASTPKKLEPLPMLTDHSLRLDDDQGVAPTLPNLRQPDPE